MRAEFYKPTVILRRPKMAKKEAESKEVAVQAPRQMAALTQQALVEDWGVPTTASNDIVIPKILPMQGQSVLVQDARAQIGEFRNSVDGALIGSIAAPFECIPFYLDKVWDIMKWNEDDEQFKWDRTIPLAENPLVKEYNDNLKWEDEEDGVKIKRIRRMNFYVLLPKEIKDGSALPYVLSFKSTSLKQGQVLFTQMYKRNFKAGLPPAAFAVNIGGTKQKNDKGSFIVPNVAVGRASTPEELSECLAWLKMVRKGAVKVDESDIIKEAATSVATEDLSDVTEF
jgi:hypothetical protein